MPPYKPLKYREVIVILTHLGFIPKQTGATFHQTWILKRDNKHYVPMKNLDLEHLIL